MDCTEGAPEAAVLGGFSDALDMIKNLYLGWALLNESHVREVELGTCTCSESTFEVFIDRAE